MADIRNQIINAADLDARVVEIPEWGVKVEVRGMTGRDRASFQRQLSKDEIDLERWYTDLVIATVHDPETGSKVFTVADRDVIAAKSGRVLERIATIATELSGMRPESAKEAEVELGEIPT